MAVVHVGCIIVPTVGAAGVTGWIFIVAVVADAAEVQPKSLVTVKE